MKFIQHGLVRTTIRASASIVSLFIVAALWTMTAAEAGIAPDINSKNWYWGPGNHWSYQHTNRIFPGADIPRGIGPVSPLVYALRDLGRFSQMVLQGGLYNGQRIASAEWIEDSCRRIQFTRHTGRRSI